MKLHHHINIVLQTFVLQENTVFKLGVQDNRVRVATPRQSETPPMSLETEPDSAEGTPMVEGGSKTKKVRVVSSAKQSNV